MKFCFYLDNHLKITIIIFLYLKFYFSPEIFAWNLYQRYDIGLFLLHKDWLLDLKYYLFKDPRNIIWLFTLRDIVQLLWCYKYLFCTFWKALISCRKNRNKIIMIINSLTNNNNCMLKEMQPYLRGILLNFCWNFDRWQIFLRKLQLRVIYVSRLKLTAANLEAMAWLR